jgi:hypothetical protein
VATVERATNLHRAELLTTLRAALPGLWVAVVAFVLALATIVVSLLRQPLDLVVSLAGRSDPNESPAMNAGVTAIRLIDCMATVPWAG